MERRVIALGPTAHVDTFTRDHLPPFDQWPDLLLHRPEFQYPEYLNVAVETGYRAAGEILANLK